MLYKIWKNGQGEWMINALKQYNHQVNSRLYLKAEYLIKLPLKYFQFYHVAISDTKAWKILSSEKSVISYFF